MLVPLKPHDPNPSGGGAITTTADLVILGVLLVVWLAGLTMMVAPTRPRNRLIGVGLAVFGALVCGLWISNTD